MILTISLVSTTMTILATAGTTTLLLMLLLVFLVFLIRKAAMLPFLSRFRVLGLGFGVLLKHSFLAQLFGEQGPLHKQVWSKIQGIQRAQLIMRWAAKWQRAGPRSVVIGYRLAPVTIAHRP